MRWSGSDDEGGSAINNDDLFVSIDSEPFVVWLSNTPLTQATLFGSLGVDDGDVTLNGTVGRDDAAALIRSYGQALGAASSPEARHILKPLTVDESYDPWRLNQPKTPVPDCFDDIRICPSTSAGNRL